MLKVILSQVTLVLLSFALGQAQGDLLITLVRDEVSARPAENLNVVIRIANAGNSPISATGSVNLPAGWSVVVPPGNVDLLSGYGTKLDYQFTPP